LIEAVEDGGQAAFTAAADFVNGSQFVGAALQFALPRTRYVLGQNSTCRRRGESEDLHATVHIAYIRRF
jgi:hypothetical protein